jgi:hypothetical protein
MSFYYDSEKPVFVLTPLSSGVIVNVLGSSGVIVNVLGSSGVIVNVLGSNAVDRGFEPWFYYDSEKPVFVLTPLC